jgi:glutaminyl-peptide cyclotransferase
VPVTFRRIWLSAFVAAAVFCIGCSHSASISSAAPAAPSSASASQPSTQAAAQPVIPNSELAPPASQTAGFDGTKAYEFTAKLVAFGPRPPASDAIHRTQDYIIGELKGFGCQVDVDDFHSSTPIGNVAMKNIVARTPVPSGAAAKGIILLLTHYDTLRKESQEYHPTGPGDFVGAVDAGSSTGLMLEMARDLCAAPQSPNQVWMAFLDGEEAFVNWNQDNDNTYGARQLAAKMAASGDLKRVHAVLLADMVGPQNLKLDKESNSTPWLQDLVWSTATRLGYRDAFTPQEAAGISDDHLAFLQRGVACVDLIDLNNYTYWHTQDDTIDKVSPRSLATVGHVMTVTIAELQKKFH